MQIDNTIEIRFFMQVKLGRCRHHRWGILTTETYTQVGPKSLFFLARNRTSLLDDCNTHEVMKRFKTVNGKANRVELHQESDNENKILLSQITKTQDFKRVEKGFCFFFSVLRIPLAIAFTVNAFLQTNESHSFLKTILGINLTL